MGNDKFWEEVNQRTGTDILTIVMDLVNHRTNATQAMNKIGERCSMVREICYEPEVGEEVSIWCCKVGWVIKFLQGSRTDNTEYYPEKILKVSKNLVSTTVHTIDRASGYKQSAILISKG